MVDSTDDEKEMKPTLGEQKSMEEGEVLRGGDPEPSGPSRQQGDVDELAAGEKRTKTREDEYRYLIIFIHFY